MQAADRSPLAIPRQGALSQPCVEALCFKRLRQPNRRKPPALVGEDVVFHQEHAGSFVLLNLIFFSLLRGAPPPLARPSRPRYATLGPRAVIASGNCSIVLEREHSRVQLGHVLVEGLDQIDEGGVEPCRRPRHRLQPQLTGDRRPVLAISVSMSCSLAQFVLLYPVSLSY